MRITLDEKQNKTKTVGSFVHFWFHIDIVNMQIIFYCLHFYQGDRHCSAFGFASLIACIYTLQIEAYFVRCCLFFVSSLDNISFQMSLE